MKPKCRILLTVTLAMTCAASACAQSAGVAPSAEPITPGQPSVKSTARRLQAVVSSLPGAAGEYNVYASSRYSSDAVPPVVIQFGATDAAVIGAMEEDLTIMTHIVDRALERIGENDVDEKFGVKLHYTSGGKSVRGLYLEGFGPLFMVKVNFPVHSPGTVETKTTNTVDDSEWERVRRQVYGTDKDIRWAGSSSSGVPYEAGRVDVLKKHLIQALKHASNMKGIKPDEHVNVSVFGSPAAVDGESYGRSSAGAPGAANGLPVARVGKGGSGSGGVAVGGRAPRPVTSVELARTALQGTVLTLRVRKSDIDAATKGDLDDEAFAKKVMVNTYAGNGSGVTSVNSWIRSSSGMRPR